MKSIQTDQFFGMLLSIAVGLVSKKDELTIADQAIGDGDHGIGMARGFEAVLTELGKKTDLSIGEACKKTGLVLMSSMGGASGAIFGSLFLGMAKPLEEATSLSSELLIDALESGLEKIQKRGGAKPGDKTMIDALSPAIEATKREQSQDLQIVLQIAKEAAYSGLMKTKEMIATTGKSKTLGERSLGFVDPGALSMFYILDCMHDFVSHIDVENG